MMQGPTHIKIILTFVVEISIPFERFHVYYILRVNNLIILYEEVVITFRHAYSCETWSSQIVVWHESKPGCTASHTRPCLKNPNILTGNRGSTVVKALCYKSEGRWFDPSWCHWNFSLTWNPSDRIMALRSTQPLTEMSTGSISWGVKAAGA